MTGWPVSDTPQIWAKRFANRPWTSADPDVRPQRSHRPRRDIKRTGMVRQWWLLTRRNVDVLVRNRLTLAVLLGSPVLVTAMMATLFKRGAFDPGGAADVGPAQIVFWIAFDGFFFGLTYGLLQIVGEMAVFRRERLAGLSVGAYVASKITALLPVLAGVSAVLLGVLRVLGRLPAVGWDVYALLFVTIVIEATSALALGLLASAAVSNAAQAALALPMLCFPQVLFGGAIVPVDQMATPGRLMSLVLSNRHAFDALGRELNLERYTATLPAMSAYRNTFHGGTGASLIALASFAVVLTLATVWVLDRRSARRIPAMTAPRGHRVSQARRRSGRAVSRTSWPRFGSRPRSWHRCARRDCARSSRKSKGQKRFAGWMIPVRRGTKPRPPAGSTPPAWRPCAPAGDPRPPGRLQRRRCPGGRGRLRFAASWPRRPRPGHRDAAGVPLPRNSFRQHQGFDRELRGPHPADRSDNPTRPIVRDGSPQPHGQPSAHRPGPRSCRSDTDVNSRARVRRGSIHPAFPTRRFDTPIRPRS